MIVVNRTNYNIIILGFEWKTGKFNNVRIFKACVRYFLTNVYLSPNDSPSKTMKDAFYLI